MALSTEQKHDVVFYLGYAGSVLLPDSTNYNSIINDRLNETNQIIEDQVDSLLTQISDSREKLLALQGQGKLKQVGDIVFNTDNNERTLKMDYNRLLKELSSLLDIPLRKKSRMGNVCL
jgi:hypothetical protein